MHMNVLKKNIGRFPVGIWISLIALLLVFLAWVMQAYSLFDWEGAVKLGLQNGNFVGDDVERALASKEKGEAIADLLWPLPIASIAFVGLLKKKLIGFVAAMMEFAICVYFPLFYIFQLWNTHLETALAATILWAIPSLLGMVGLWTNRKIFNS
jgi:hypothetical protein